MIDSTKFDKLIDMSLEDEDAFLEEYSKLDSTTKAIFDKANSLLGDNDAYYSYRDSVIKPAKATSKTASNPYDFEQVHKLPISNPVRRAFELGFNNLTPQEKEVFTNDYYQKLANDRGSVEQFFGKGFDSFVNKMGELSDQYQEKFQPNPIARTVQDFGRGVLGAKNWIDEAARLDRAKSLGENLGATTLNTVFPIPIARDMLRQVTLDPSVLTSETTPKDIVTEFGVKASEILPMLLTGGESAAASTAASTVAKKAFGSPVTRSIMSGGAGAIHSLLRDIQNERNTGDSNSFWRDMGEAALGGLVGTATQAIPEAVTYRATRPNQEYVKYPSAFKLLSRDANYDYTRGSTSPEVLIEFLDELSTNISRAKVGGKFPPDQYRPTAIRTLENMRQQMRDRYYKPAQELATRFVQAAPDDEVVFPSFFDPTKQIGTGNDIMSSVFKSLVGRSGGMTSVEADKAIKEQLFPMVSSIPYDRVQKMFTHKPEVIKEREFNEALDAFNDIDANYEWVAARQLKELQSKLTQSKLLDESILNDLNNRLNVARKNLEAGRISLQPELVSKSTKEIKELEKAIASHKPSKETVALGKQVDSYKGPTELNTEYNTALAKVQKIEKQKPTTLTPQELVALNVGEKHKPLNQPILGAYDASKSYSPFDWDHPLEYARHSGGYLPEYYPELRAGLRDQISINRTSPDLSKKEDLAKVFLDVLGEEYRRPIGYNQEVPELGTGSWKDNKWYPDTQVEKILTPEVDSKYGQLSSLLKATEQTDDVPGRQRFAQGSIFSWINPGKWLPGRQVQRYTADYKHPAYKTAIDDYMEEAKIQDLLKGLGGAVPEARVLPAFLRLKDYGAREYVEELQNPNNIRNRLRSPENQEYRGTEEQFNKYQLPIR